MSEPQSRQMDGSREVLAAQHVLRIAMETGRLNRDMDIVHSHTKQIESLRKEIEEKNEAQLRLNKKLKELQEQNDELKITLESKDEETKALKEKISKLENEKKALETKLRSVESELKAVREEVVELKEANKTSEERNAVLDMDVKKLSKKMDAVSKDLEESMIENSTLHKEVKGLKEQVENMASIGVPGGMGLPFLGLSADPVEKASLVLGEMCRRIQGMMYQKVLPNYYDNRKSYKVKHIEEDIQELEDEGQRNEAMERLVALQKKLKWKKTKHTRAMKSIQENRNDTAHPDLNEELLVSSVTLMDQVGKLTDWHSAECVNELIKMWKQLLAEDVNRRQQQRLARDNIGEKRVFAGSKNIP